MQRRRFLAATTGIAIAGCTTGRNEERTTTDARTPPGTTPSQPSGSGPDNVGLETLATGLQNPVDVVFPSSDRLLVAEQPGTVRVVDGDGLRSEPALDLRDAVATGFEKGLLGLARHPEFDSNRRLFVRYSAPRRAGTPSGYSHTFVLAEFTVGEDGTRVRRDSEQSVLEIPQPQGNHNAGSIAFGPGGYLYVGVGDGGSGGDRGRGHVEDWYDAVDGGNGQDVTENHLGSILRIDVREDATGYAIPEDNPLVGREGLDEQYAWGFRNPWRLAFDGTDLYAGDVGQNRYEEVDRVHKGGNYGWNVREGTHCYGTGSCPDTTPASVRGGEPLVDPVIEYPHTDAAVSGISVIAGNVYRGEAIPQLDGQFVFGDYRADGRLFVAEPGDTTPWTTGVVPIADDDASKLSRLLSMQRHDGELYVLGNGQSGGGVHRLVPAE